jgi:hypothetical protein
MAEMRQFCEELAALATDHPHAVLSTHDTPSVIA